MDHNALHNVGVPYNHQYRLQQELKNGPIIPASFYSQNPTPQKYLPMKVSTQRQYTSPYAPLTQQRSSQPAVTPAFQTTKPMETDSEVESLFERTMTPAPMVQPIYGHAGTGNLYTHHNLQNAHSRLPLMQACALTPPVQSSHPAHSQMLPYMPGPYPSAHNQGLSATDFSRAPFQTTRQPSEQAHFEQRSRNHMVQSQRLSATPRLQHENEQLRAQV
jgi:hypothetical protein